MTGITLVLLASLIPGEGVGGMDDLYCSTFSIAAVDTATGECGVAVASRVLAVGHIVPWAEPGAGAVATQALANAGFGPAGLDLLAGGMAAGDVLDSLLATDPGREERQLGVVDFSGRSATFTGTGTMDWAGGVAGPGYAIQGNILTGPGVVAAMEEAFLSSEGPLSWRLLQALVAGDAAGGDSRGRQSAALLVVRSGGGYQGAGDRLVDIRIDDNPDPVTELARVYSLWEPAFAFAIYLDSGLPADEPHALDIMERALAAGIRDSETLNSFAWTLAERGLFPERALELALEAHALAPDDANIMDTLAQAYFSAGQYANAVTWEQEALRREPGSTFFSEQMRRFQEALDATGRAPLPILQDGE